MLTINSNNKMSYDMKDSHYITSHITPQPHHEHHPKSTGRPTTLSWLTAKHDSDDDSDEEQDDASRNLVGKRDKRVKWMIKSKGPATDPKRKVATPLASQK